MEVPVAEQQIRFDDGAAYEERMGKWSRLAGNVFLDWLAPVSNLRWVDVGCGNGAFTELIVERCAPSAIQGIDPSSGQISYARARPGAASSKFEVGDALGLPYDARSFDIAVMALVLFFVPDPVKAIAEMKRVVRTGGTVTAYVWDIFAGGLPHQEIRTQMHAIGQPTPVPPSSHVSAQNALRDLWTDAGLEKVETREILVHRTYDDFDEYWNVCLLGHGVRPAIAAMSEADAQAFQARIRANLQVDASGRITCAARANAVKGRVPQ